MKARAIIIGINQYPSATGQRMLHGAVNDAVDFASWAVDPDGGQVPIENCYFWGFPAPAALPPVLARLGDADRPWPLDPPQEFAQTPSAQAITLALEAAADLSRAASLESDGGERLYVFLAGHGAMTTPKSLSEDSQNCLVASDYAPNTAFGLVPLDDLRRMLERRGPREVLLISDCCRTALPQTVPSPILNVSEYNDLGYNDQWLTGRAARAGAIAYETPLDEPTRGAFTKTLVQALRQYRIDGQLTLTDLRGFVRHGVKKLVTPKSQVPGFLLKVEDSEDEPFVVVNGQPIGELPKVSILFPAGLDGEIRLIDSRDNVHGDPLTIADRKVEVPLAPGQYSAEHVATGHHTEFFHFGPETTDVQF